jgi:uncharacterized membrane protein
MRRDNLLNGVVLGAGLMYLLDPDRGGRRRARLRDQVVHLINKAGEAADTAARDLGNRGRGMVAEGRSRLRSETVSQSVLEARVRSELGRLVTHPGAIEVVADGGRVTLCGPVLADEVDALLSGVSSVRGVEEVENRLEVHERAGDVPGLQGQGPRPEPRFELLQENWSPAARLLMGILGGTLALRGMRGRGPLDAALAVTGLGILSRAATNMETKRLTGVGAGRRAIEIHKTVNIDAPVEEVFAFWSNYENFPRFMSHLKEVRLTGEGRSHWVAEGPAGVPIAWDAETTAYEENRVIAWKSIGEAPVGNAGIVRFLPNPEGGTRADIRLSYNPPAGALGHAVASFFGADPKHAMDDDMVRLKSLLELGKASSHGETVMREEVGGRLS